MCHLPIDVVGVVGVRMRDLTSTPDLAHSTTDFEHNFVIKVEFKVEKINYVMNRVLTPFLMTVIFSKLNWGGVNFEPSFDLQ